MQSVIEKILSFEGITISEFAKRLDLHFTTPYKWQTDDRTPTAANIRRIEKEFSVRLVRDRNGEIVGVEKITTDEKVSSIDLDNGTTVSDISAFTPPDFSEPHMIDLYNELAAQARLPHWEDLTSEQRDDVKSEMVLAKSEVERTLNAFRSEVIKLIKKRRGH